MQSSDFPVWKTISVVLDKCIRTNRQCHPPLVTEDCFSYFSKVCQEQFVTSALEKGQHGLQKHFSIQLTVHKLVSGRQCAFRNTAALHRIKQQLSAGFGIPAGPGLCAGWKQCWGHMQGGPDFLQLEQAGKCSPGTASTVIFPLL